jgi:hypothetical protein
MRVGKANGSRECAPDDRLRVPTKNAFLDAMVGTALTRLCPPYAPGPPYAFTSLIRPALAIEIAELGVAERPQAGAVEIHEAQPPPT